MLVVIAVGQRPAPTIGADDVIDVLRLPADAELRAAAETTIPVVPPAIEADIELGRILEETVATFEAMPSGEWDPYALAVGLEFDPIRAFEFVRDRIAFDPYRGVLRGSFGTLAARAGNSFDRASLLKSLLDAMGRDTRFAFAQLDPDTADAVVARAFEAVQSPLPSAPEQARSSVDLSALGARATRDYALIVEALGDRVGDLEASALDDARSDVRAHAWVQMATGPEWLDLDPTLANAQAGGTLTPADRVATELPASEVHRVGVAVQADILDGGGLHAQTLLDETLDAWSAASGETYLMFVPELEGIGGAIADALGTAASYSPQLIVDGEVRKGSPFPVRPAEDIFAAEEIGGPELARLRVTVTVSVPGREPVVHVRTVVDRVPTERAASPRLLRPDELVPLVADRAGPLALQPLHHVMVSTGGMSPWWYTVRQGHAIEFVNRLLQDQGSAASYSLPELLLPFAVANEGLVLASERSIVPSLASGNGLVAFVAEPRVFLVSLGLGSGEPTSAQGSTDLMHDQVRVLAAEGSEHAAARAQLWYGTLETALETEQAMRIAANGGVGASVQSVSTLMGGPLTVLGPDLGAPSDLGIPGDLAAALREGRLVVVPGDPSTTLGWWTIAPDGSTRSTRPGGAGWTRFISPDITKRGTGPGVNTVDPETGRAVSGKLPGEPVAPRQCPRNEYMLIVVCVSIPGMIVLAGIGIMVTVIALWAVGVIGSP